MELAINRLSTQLRIDSLDIVLSLGNLNRDVEERLTKRLYDTVRDIKESKIEQHAKNILGLYAAGYLHQLGIKLFTSGITRLRIIEKTFGPLPLADRAEEAQRVIKLTDDAIQMVQDIWESLNEKEKEARLGAHVHYRLSEMFFSLSFSVFMMNGGPSGREVESLFLRRYFSAITAFNIFIQNVEYDEAYSAITTAYEIRTLHDYIFNKKMKDQPIQNIIDRIEQISAKTGRECYQSLVNRFLNEDLPQIKSRGFVEMDDSEIDKYAEKYATALGLPDNRIVNLVADLRAIKRFKSVIPDKNAELLQNLSHTRSIDTLYASPVVYTGHCSRCGFTTNPAAMVEDIIKEFASSHGESCPK
jgi:hypothetical protein